MLVGGDGSGMTAAATAYRNASADLEGIAGDLRRAAQRAGDAGDPRVATALERCAAALAGAALADSLGVAALGRAATVQSRLLDVVAGG